MGRTNFRHKEQRKLLWRRQGGLCYWCKKPTRLLKTTGGPIPEDAATIDHLDSRLSPERGKHKGEWRHVMACSKCNHERARAEDMALPRETQHERSKRHPTNIMRAALIDAGAEPPHESQH